MNEKSNLLKKNIEKYFKPSFFIKAKKLLKKYIDENNKIDTNFQGNALLLVLDASEKLIDQDESSRYSFIQSPSIDEKIFEPIKSQIKKIKETIKSIKNDDDVGPTELSKQLIESLENLINRHNEYMEELVNKCKNQIEKKEIITNKLFSSPGIIITPYDFLEYEISLNDAYKISSYNPIEHIFSKGDKESEAMSIGSKVDDVYFKVDTGNHLLVPSKENSVFNFYNLLFSNDNFISPTQLLFLYDIPILPIHSSESTARNELIHFSLDMAEKQKSNQYMISAKEAFNSRPYLLKNVINSLKEETLSIQASHIVKGKTLKKFLLEAHDNPSLFQLIDKESFTAHVVSSFLLIPTDYKADNLIVEEGTNRIVGIDNDKAIDSDELVYKNGNYYVEAKNILYTLPLMKDIIHPKIKEVLLKVNPYVFTVNWLYNSLVSDNSLVNLVELLPIKIIKNLKMKSISIQEGIQNFKNTLSLPTFIPKGWSIKFYQRFCLIQNKVKENESITLLELFQMVHEYLSEFYKCLESKVPPVEGRPQDLLSKYLYQMFLLYKGNLEFVDLIKNYSKLDLNSIEILISKLSDTTNGVVGSCGILNGNDKEDEKRKIGFLGSILELIQQIPFEPSLFRNNEHLLQFIKIIYKLSKNEQNANYLFEIKDFHQSWYINRYEILIKLIKIGSECKYLKYFIEIFKVDLNDPIKSLKESVYHAAINSNNSNLLHQVKSFHSLGANFNVVNDDVSPIVLSIREKNFELFFIFLIFGAIVINENHREFINYYKTLNHDQKVILKDTMDLLYHNNQKLAWDLALSELLPLLNIDNQMLAGDILIDAEFQRILRKKNVDQIIKLNPITKLWEPFKTNPLGVRCVPFISNDYGHRIFFKFQPQMPGVEISINRLTEKLFGNCTPYNDLCKISDDHYKLFNEIVLLVQSVPGDTLCELFYKKGDKPNQFIVVPFPPELNQMCSYSMSQTLITSMIINNSDGNLGNFIISKIDSCSGNDKYRIVSIDTDQAFMPPVSKPIKESFFTKKQSLQVETVVFLLDHMFDYVDEKLIWEVIKLDMDKLVESWLDGLKYYHDGSLEKFKNVQLLGETVIGIPFTPGMIKRLYSKLIRLKLVFQDLSNDKMKITHFDLLKILEPEIASRHKSFLFEKSLSVVDRFSKFRNTGQPATFENLSSSFNKAAMLVQSREIPNGDDIIKVLRGGTFTPVNAYEEFLEIKNQNIKFASIKDTGKQLGPISDGVVENLLPETKFSEMTISQEIKFFEAIQTRNPREIGLIKINNSSTFTLSMFYNLFNQKNITKINLFNCKEFEGFKNISIMASTNFLELPNLTSLIVNNCPKLTSIKIKSDSLNDLKASKCPLLKEFNIESPNLEYLTLFDSLSKSNLIILELIGRNKNLVYLDIGFSKIKSFESYNIDLYLIFPKLKQFKANNFIGINKFIVYLPVVKIFEIDLSYATLMIGQAQLLKPPPITMDESQKELLNNLSKIQVNTIGLKFNEGKEIYDYLSSNYQSYNFTFDSNNLIENQITDIKSKLFIQSSYCTNFNIIILRLYDLTNSINHLTNLLSRFNLKSSPGTIKPLEFNHCKFILVKIGFSIDECQSSKIIQEFQQKFRIDDQLVITGFNQEFASSLIKVLKKHE